MFDVKQGCQQLFDEVVAFGITNIEKDIDKNDRHLRFDINESALPLGIETLVGVSINTLTAK